MTFEQRPVEANHVGLWEKNIPDGGKSEYKGLMWKLPVEFGDTGMEGDEDIEVAAVGWVT